MAGNLGALVGLASSSPNAAVILNGWPHEALGDELSRYFNLEACRELFKRLNIFPLQSQYVFSLSLFVVKNLNMFKPNKLFHSINTRHCSDLHQPPVKLTKVQKGVYYSGIKVFNCLPTNIKSLSNDVKKFKSALKAFLLDGSFYTIQEFFDCSSIH